MKKIVSLLLVMLLCLSLLVSCGEASKDGSVGYLPENSNPGDSPIQKYPTADGDTSKAPDSDEDYERKIIKTYALTLETKKYESAKGDILNAAKALGGYISDSSEKDSVTSQGKKDRHASFTVRVPSDKVDEYVEAIDENASVLSKKLSTEDITTSYYNLESQLESLLEQQARIEKLMDEATNFSHLMELEDKLTSIRTQINNINKQIQIYDKSVALSYVYITLDEVVEYTEIVDEEPTFFNRVGEAFVGAFQNFGKFCQDIFIAFIWMLPTLLVASAIVVFIIVLKRYSEKKKKSKTDTTPKN